MVVCAPEGELPLMAERAGAEVNTVGIGKFRRYSIRQPAGSVKDMILAARHDCEDLLHVRMDENCSEAPGSFGNVWTMISI